MASTCVLAQGEAYKGNPHVIIPVDKPLASVPFDQQHITLPMPDSQATNLFCKGYQTFAGEVSMIRIASRLAPERLHFMKIGDFAGNYRIDRLVNTGMDYALYLVKSNETAIIRAHQASETHKNTIEQGNPGHGRQRAAPSER